MSLYVCMPLYTHDTLQGFFFREKVKDIFDVAKYKYACFSEVSHVMRKRFLFFTRRCQTGTKAVVTHYPGRRVSFVGW